MQIFIGSDHRGFKLKEVIKVWLSASGNEVVDCGNSVYDPDDDFPDFSFIVADKVISANNSLGIVICGSGGGVTIAANKVKGVRCAQAVNLRDVIHNRKHDDINVLAIGSDFVSEDEAKKMIMAFIETRFDPEERFVRRLGKIKKREEVKVNR